MKFFAKDKMGKNTPAFIYEPGKKKKDINWKKVIWILAGIFLFLGLGFLFKTGHILNKVSTRGNIFENLIHIIPGVESRVAGEDEGRINMLLLGMRGEHVDGGGLLADTIMVASIKTEENKGSLFSIPRDLYVDVPDRGFKSKINSVYFYGEEKGKGHGLEDMKKVVSEIVGSPIHYAASIDFKGFTELVDSLEGIELHLEEPFIEPLQFKEEHVCDENVFTVPSGNTEVKKNEKGKVVAEYPLCYNAQLECGGVFELPAGDMTLNGEQALCYVRSRVTSSDFDRARRQQEVLKQTKAKALSLGTLTDFGRINGMLDSLGDNVRTDMQLWEMKRIFEIYQQMGEIEIAQKVLENSEEGLLYAPEDYPEEVGYILLPRGDNYDRIREAFININNLSASN